jgi:AcrR family transcriptional regulator
VVQAVLAAVRGELARVGYRALRIEDVAVKANVHKTTIYRRWPVKADLVRETLLAMFQENIAVPDTGSLRGDLLEAGHSMVRFASHPDGMSLLRMCTAEGTEPELRAIVDSLRSSTEAPPQRIVANALARGEVHPNLDAELLVSTLAGAIHHRLFIIQDLRPDHVERVVDLLLNGATPRTG